MHLLEGAGADALERDVARGALALARVCALRDAVAAQEVSVLALREEDTLVNMASFTSSVTVQHVL